MMKNKFYKIVVTVLLAAIFLFVAIHLYNDKTVSEKINAYFSVFIFPNDFSKDNQPFSTHNFNELTNIERQAYICIYNNISTHPKYIKIPALTSEEFNRVYFAVKNDNPNMLCFSDSCTMSTIGSVCLLQLTYNCDVDECNEKQALLMKTVDFIVNEMPDFNDDYSKELYIHDYIVKNCTYKESETASTAYGCLVDGVAVCSGYSRAAMLLFKQAGIDSMLVGGNGHSETQGTVSHMWNIVWIDNEAYHLDVTWDDPVNEDENYLSHMYFNLTDEQISDDHSDYTLSFECNSDKYGYFQYNNLMFDAYDAGVLDTVKFKLLNNINNGSNYIEFSFNNESAYESAVDNLIDNTKVGADIYNVLAYLSKYVVGNTDVSRVILTHDDNKRYIRMMFNNME